jgi:hypothetical protein
VKFRIKGSIRGSKTTFQFDYLITTMSNFKLSYNVSPEDVLVAENLSPTSRC